MSLEGLTSYGLYGPEEYTRHYQRQDYEANPINAVVVLEWDSKEKGNHVYLTNGPVDEPFEVFDDYKERDLGICSSISRNATNKGRWFKPSSAPLYKPWQ